MADETATFALDIEGLADIKGLAAGSASALEDLRGAISSDVAALSDMQKALRLLKGGGEAAKQQITELTARIGAQRSKVASSQAAFVKFGGTFGKKLEPPIPPTFPERLKAAEKPLANLTASFKALRGTVLGGAVIGGLAAIAVGFVAMGAAVLGAVAALTAYGIAAAGARRSELLSLEGLTKTRNFYGIAAGKASDLQAAIDRVSDSSSLGRDQLGQMAQGLYRSNLRGAALSQALEGVAMATDAAGESQGEFYKAMFLGAGRYGGSAKRVLDDVKARFGEVAARKALGWEVQTRKLKENFGRIFSGLKIEGLLTAIKTVTDLFSQSTASGRALKSLTETLLQPLINGIEKTGPIAKRFFQGLIIGGLLVSIGLQRVRNWWIKTFGGSETLKGLDLAKAALWAGVIAAGALAGVVGGLAAAVLALGAVIAIPVAMFGLFVGAMNRAGENAKQLGTKFGQAGLEISKGIGKGILDGAKWVISAITQIADTAVATFKKKLKIASPSGAFAAEAKWIGPGVEGPVRKSIPRVQAAVRALVEVPKLGARAGAGGGAVQVEAPQVQALPGLAARTVHVEIHQLNVTAGGPDAKTIAQDVRAELLRELEGAALELGVV